MGRLYSSATEHINKHQYDVLVPGYYTAPPQSAPSAQMVVSRMCGNLMMSKSTYEETPIPPIFVSDDPHAFYKSKKAIYEMVDMMSSKVPFTITHDHDVLDILHSIDAYIEEAHPSASINQEVASYMGKIIILRKRIYTLFRRVLNRHPDWKEKYREQEGITAIIEQMYNIIGIPVPTLTNTVESLAKAPHEFDNRPLSEKLKDLDDPTVHRKIDYGV